MSRFDQSGIDEVRERADIGSIIGDHVRLKKAGKELVGLCPFHDEKTPSFFVEPFKGVYLCRGCGASGDVFRFVQEIEGLTFSEAVQQLADRSGVELVQTQSQGRTESPRSKMLKLHELAVKTYQGFLAHKEGSSAREYLEERKLASEAAAHHSVGFGGWTPNGLLSALTRAGFTTKEAVDAGVARQDGRGLRDVFYGRIIFPIFDAAGRPIAFGGRVLPESYRARSAPDAPKYLNSAQTPLFQKSKVLYGLNWARLGVGRSNRVVIVEGYTDVMAFHAAGVIEAVATCGTALTDGHVAEISRRFGDVEIILCLDGDAAGRAAAAKASQTIVSEGGSTSKGWLPLGRGWLPEVKVALLPAGVDPADFALSKPPAETQALLNSAVPLIEFLLSEVLGSGESPNDPQSRVDAVRKGAEVLAAVPNPLLRHEYSLWLSGLTGVDTHQVVAEVQRRLPKGKSKSRELPRVEMLSGVDRIEREALKALASDPTLVTQLKENDFELALHRNIYRLLISQTAGDKPSNLLANVEDASAREILAELFTEDAAVASLVGNNEVIQRLRAAHLARDIDERKKTLGKLDPVKDDKAYDALFEELLRLEKARREISATG